MKGTLPTASTINDGRGVTTVASATIGSENPLGNTATQQIMATNCSDSRKRCHTELTNRSTDVKVKGKPPHYILKQSCKGIYNMDRTNILIWSYNENKGIGEYYGGLKSSWIDGGIFRQIEMMLGGLRRWHRGQLLSELIQKSKARDTWHDLVRHTMMVLMKGLQERMTQYQIKVNILRTNSHTVTQYDCESCTNQQSPKDRPLNSNVSAKFLEYRGSR